ncbi:Uncharacterised protein [uncultured archaeon]|nr:Uncharacterised protein [uncultured archaeon]
MKKLNDRGFVYSLTIVLLVLILLSLILFYVYVSDIGLSDSANTMETDDIHYYVEAVRMDFTRAASVSGQRAGVYAVDAILKNGESLENYAYTPCSNLQTSLTGAPAAIAELAYCGTYKGQYAGPAPYMQNNTLRDWQTRAIAQGKELGYAVNLSITSFAVVPFDAMHYALLAEVDLEVYSSTNKSLYRGYGIPLFAVAGINSMEDPLIYLKTKEPALLRYYAECPQAETLDGTETDSRLTTPCYLPSNEGPSFFDRLEGRINLSEKYRNQSELMLSSLELNVTPVGIESFINLDEVAKYAVPVTINLTWVDYAYFAGLPGYCTTNTAKYPEFRIDLNHALSYNMRPLNCFVFVFFDGAADSLNPSPIQVPAGTTITWVNANYDLSHTIYVDDPGFGEPRDMPPLSQISWTFNSAGTYKAYDIRYSANGVVEVT